MSAFAGLLNLDGRPVDARLLQRLGNALPRFGERPPATRRAGPLGLVHRTFVITREDRFDRQPLLGGGGRYHLVFAGSLDNRNELAGALGIAPEALREMADGSVVLAALERWGDETAERLFGGFAYALWDETEQRLQLGRDRRGGRPLFLHRGQRFLAFASTVSALLALPDVPREMDAVVVADLLALNSAEPRRTVYRGIERLPSGTLALCGSGGKLEFREYWNPQRRALGFKRHEDYVDAAREMLERCVASALRGERPVGLTASGGLDSSGVAATAARQVAPEPLAVYTRVPPPGFAKAETARKYFDERPKVEALARLHPNMRLTFVDDAGPHVLDVDQRRATAAFGVPMIGVVNFGWFAGLYDRVAANGHRVLVGGGGGNNSLGWHAPGRLDEMMREGSFAGAAKEAAAFRRVTGRSWLSVLRHRILAPWEPPALRRARRQWQGLGIGFEHNGFLAPDFAKAHGVAERVAAMSRWADGIRGADAFTQRVHATVRSNEIGRDRRAAMLELYGFEMRFPLADARMIELCLNIPDEHYMREGRPRALQRDVIADRVPPAIVENFKVGEQSPEWFDRIDPQRETILKDIERIERSALASSMIDMQRLKRATEDWPATAEAADAREGELRRGLMRAIAIGRFICWFEGGNA